MTDDPSPSDDTASSEPATFSGKRVLLVLLVIAVLLQGFFILLVWSTRRTKQSLPKDHPLHISTSRPVEHITNGNE